MKKILGLLLVSSSIFSIQLDHVKPEKLPAKLSQCISFNMGNEKKVQINPSLVRVSHKLGDVELYYGKKGFIVWQDDKKQVIQKCFTDPMMRNITKEQLHAFLQAGYLSLNQMNDGTFSLQAKGRIVGGGPILGAIMYWLTKSTCYGVAGVAVGAAVVTTAGVGVGVATGLAATVTGMGMATAATAATTTVIATTAGTLAVAGATTTAVVGATTVIITGVTTAASASGAVIAGTSLVTAASLTTVAGVTAVSGTSAAAAVGTAAATVIAVESLSAAVGTFFGMLPTP